jgi:uncharacterized membrane protein YphA (DoxX/SURF4 family)
VKALEGTVSDTRKHLFKVGGCIVETASGELPIIKDGDMASVAGYMRRGIIKPYAIHNITEQIIQHESYVRSLLAGILVVACGVFIVSGFSLPLIALGCMVFLIGILMIAKGIAIIRAVKFVSESRT